MPADLIYIYMEREKGKNEITEINGVVLTPNAFQALRNLQEDHNCMIDSMTDRIADISDYFAQELHILDSHDKDKNIKEFINELSYIRRYIKDLRKP
jgi:hypothetical protein